jgi:excisionase family DNA binding protein
MNDLSKNDLMRPKKAAETLDVSRSTIYYWIATGRLEAVKLPGKTLRIRKSAVDDAQKSTLA